MNASASTDLAQCMKFIKEYGVFSKKPLLWARRTLDHLSRNTKPEQLMHILNGYADLFQIVIYLIEYSSRTIINSENIRTFAGTSKKRIQKQRCRNIVYIAYYSEESLFSSIFAHGSDGKPQTCFDTADERISDYIIQAIRWQNQSKTETNSITYKIF